jgi:hypothetical protein
MPSPFSAEAAGIKFHPDPGKSHQSEQLDSTSRSPQTLFPTSVFFLGEGRGGVHFTTANVTLYELANQIADASCILEKQ